jgi:lipopolysaccharide export system permease protein
MRLLDRYLLRELVIPLGYCLGGFLLFWIFFDLFTELDSLQQDKLTAWEIALYYLVRLPELLGIILPVALLLALLYALTNHARHQELTAMRAAGLSLWRVAAPYLGVGLGLSLLLYLLNERWVPDSGERAERIRKGHRPGTAEEASPLWEWDLKFRNGRDGRFWRIRAYHVGTGEMREPYVEWTSPDGSRRQLVAQRAVRAEGVWTFYQAREFVLQGAGDPQPRQALHEALAVPEFTETPEQIQSEIRVSRLSNVRAAKRVQLSIAEILHYQRLHPELRSRERALLETQLQARLAAPWTCLVVVLIAVPFGAAAGRRNALVGVASSIFICFIYFVLQRLGMALGTGGYVPPLLAGWLPNCLFGSAGVWLTLRVR